MSEYLTNSQISDLASVIESFWPVLKEYCGYHYDTFYDIKTDLGSYIGILYSSFIANKQSALFNEASDEEEDNSSDSTVASLETSKTILGVDSLYDGEYLAFHLIIEDVCILLKE